MLLFAKVKYVESKYEYVDFKKACALFKMDTSLVTAESLSKLSCMGEELETKKVCMNLYEHKMNLARSYTDAQEKKVVCQFAKTIRVKLECSDKKIYKCRDSKKDCKLVGSRYAYTHKLYHHFSNGQYLSCIFQN